MVDEIMKPGRELDAFVAEKIFECKVVWEGRDAEPYCHCKHFIHCQSNISDPLKEYSTDISAAWEVVEKMQSRPGKSRTGDFSLETPGDVWVAKWSDWFEGRGTVFYTAEAPTAPHAICLAALKAVNFAQLR